MSNDFVPDKNVRIMTAQLVVGRPVSEFPNIESGEGTQRNPSLDEDESA